MQLKIPKKVICFYGIYSILLLGMMVNVSSLYIRTIYAGITFILCIINMIKAKNNCVALVLHFQLLYYNYSVIFSQYLNRVTEYQEFYKHATESALGIGIFCLLTFEFFSLRFNSNGILFSSNKLYAEKPNLIISTGLLIVAVAIAIFSFNWNAYGGRGSISSSYEYIGILLILGLYYAGDYQNTLIKYGYSLLILGLVLQGILFGERVSALQFIFIWCFYFVYDHLKLKNIILGGLLGIVLMATVGAFRKVFSMNGINLSTIWNELTSRMLTFNGADLGYYCSLTFIMVAEKVTLTKRLELFGKFILSIFVGNSAEAYLPEFTRQYYAHWNGGFYPIYFYFYGGIPLVIVFSYMWNWFVRKCFGYNGKKYMEFFSLLSIYLVAIAARWYMYTPLSAFRPVILFSVAFFMLKVVSELVFYRK